MSPTWRSRGRILLIGCVGLAVIAIAVAVLALRGGQPDDPPGAFYTPPSPLPAGPPGAVLRQEPVEPPPPGGRAWRVLYLTSDVDGRPAAASGLVLAPTGAAPPGGRDLVAIPPGTVGVAARCGVSLLGARYWPRIDGLAAFLAAGDVVVVPDYPGLGTPGPHPYLVGPSEAASTLDLVRAARALAPAQAGDRLVVWGASQGGHAALFTGQRAASYAPDLRLVGVAASSPATDLVELFVANRETALGRVLSALTLASWSRVYPELALGDVVSPAARPVVRQMATYCIQDRRQVIAPAALSLVLRVRYLRRLPWETEPWRGLLRRNTPGAAPIPAPVLITQGGADGLVRPGVTAAFARRLCAGGATLAYRVQPGVTHFAAGPAAAGEVARWAADRFAGRPAPDTCAATLR